MEFHMIDITYAALNDIFMQRRLYIDEAHTALDIFRFAVFLFFKEMRYFSNVVSQFWWIFKKFWHQILMLHTDARYSFEDIAPEGVPETMDVMAGFYNLTVLSCYQRTRGCEGCDLSRPSRVGPVEPSTPSNQPPSQLSHLLHILVRSSQKTTVFGAEPAFHYHVWYTMDKVFLWSHQLFAS